MMILGVGMAIWIAGVYGFHSHMKMEAADNLVFDQAKWRFDRNTVTTVDVFIPKDAIQYKGQLGEGKHVYRIGPFKTSIGYLHPNLGLLSFNRADWVLPAKWADTFFFKPGGEVWWGGIPLIHPNCLKSGSLVWTSKGLIPIEKVKVGNLVLTHLGRYRPVLKCYQRQFDGEIYEILDTWFSGEHPILTKEGWMHTKLLNKGTKVICLKSNYCPTFLPKKSLLLPVLSKLSTTLMPMSPINFNSNFSVSNSEVNVKFANCILWNDIYSSILKRIQKCLFQFREFYRKLPSFRSFFKVFNGSMSTSNLVMQFRHFLYSLFRSHMFPVHLSRFRMVSMTNSSFSQNSVNHDSRNMKFFADFFDRHIFTPMQLHNLVNGQLNSVSHKTFTLSSIHKAQYKGTLYNLAVLEDQTYVVGHSRLVVHNCEGLVLHVRGWNQKMGEYIPVCEVADSTFHYDHSMAGINPNRMNLTDEDIDRAETTILKDENIDLHLKVKDLEHHLGKVLDDSVDQEKIYRDRLADAKRKYVDIMRVEPPLKYKLLNLKFFGTMLVVGVVLILLARFLGYV